MKEVSKASQWLAYGLGALAVWLATNSLLGPLFTNTIDYRFSESLINQGIGLDAVALFGVVPVAALAAVLVLRGHRAGPVLSFIPAAFAAYMAPQYVVGPEYLTLAGNNERFFLFHLGMFVLAVVLLFVAWTTVDRTHLPSRESVPERRLGWVMWGVAAFIVLGRWLPSIADVMSGEPTVADYLENPTSFFLIGFLDLGLVAPSAVATALGIRRGMTWARKAAYAVIGWFTFVPAAVAAMAVTMQINGDPNMSTGMMTVFVVAAVVFTAGATLLYRPLFTGTGRAETEPAHPPLARM